MDVTVFKEVFKTYGNSISCFEEELYEELLQYQQYMPMSKSADNVPAASCLVDLLPNIPDRFTKVRVLMLLHCH